MQSVLKFFYQISHARFTHADLLKMLSTNFTVRITVWFYICAIYYMCIQMVDNMRGIERFSSVRCSWKALISGDILVTNRTGHLLRIEVSPLNNQRVEVCRKTDANLNLSVLGSAGAGVARESTYEQATNAEKVHRSPLGDGDTAQLDGQAFRSYLTVFAILPRASGHLFKLVENARVYRWREYVFEKKHYENALAAHETTGILL